MGTVTKLCYGEELSPRYRENFAPLSEMYEVPYKREACSSFGNDMRAERGEYLNQHAESERHAGIKRTV